jgi:hypothetical protein
MMFNSATGYSPVSVSKIDRELGDCSPQERCARQKESRPAMAIESEGKDRSARRLTPDWHFGAPIEAAGVALVGDATSEEAIDEGAMGGNVKGRVALVRMRVSTLLAGNSASSVMRTRDA